MQTPTAAPGQPDAGFTESARHRTARLFLRRHMSHVCGCLLLLDRNAFGSGDFAPKRRGADVTLNVAEDGTATLSSSFDEDTGVATCLARLATTWRFDRGEATIATSATAHCDTPAMTDLMSEECVTSSIRLATELIGTDSCDGDTDCVLLPTTATSLGCGVYVNRAADLAELPPKIRSYERICGEQAPCPEEHESLTAPACRNGRCQRDEPAVDRIARMLGRDAARAAFKRIRKCTPLGVKGVKLVLQASGTTVLAVLAHQEYVPAHAPAFRCVEQQVAGIRLPKGVRSPFFVHKRWHGEHGE